MTDHRSIAVVTGSRADFGLLQPVLRAIAGHPRLELQVYVTGTHLLPPARTIDEVLAEFESAATIEMQRPDEVGRYADAIALGRGITGFAKALAKARMDVVLVLGDRIEAFAAAAAASVGGVRVAHVHGGDRAEGIADEALRHAITKLAHIHLPATAGAAERIIAMGEAPQRTHLVGSPAIDDLDAIPPLPNDEYEVLGRPEIVFLQHPAGADDATEEARAATLLALCRARGRVLALHPNHDAGRDGIMHAVLKAEDVVHRAHLTRASFIGLLRRAHLIVGNSSAGLIEAAAIPARCLDIGLRQAGREKPPNVITCPDWEPAAIERSLERAMSEPAPSFKHPYGDGSAGRRIADLLASFDPRQHPIIKHSTY